MSALDRPVRVQRLPMIANTQVRVRPSDVFAALDDEQREALSLLLFPKLPCPLGRIRKAVAAICGERA